MTVTRGKFIVLEGGEGTGKSTQVQILAERYGGVATREPGGSTLGEGIRNLVLDPNLSPSETAELLLYAADRAQHVDEVIRPALEAGRHVFCDRFWHSTLAYQGAGRGFNTDIIMTLAKIACSEVEPDLVCVLRADETITRRRRLDRGVIDRLEAEPDTFHRKVNAYYSDLCDLDPVAVDIDATGTIPEVSARLIDAIETRMGLTPVL